MSKRPKLFPARAARVTVALCFLPFQAAAEECRDMLNQLRAGGAAASVSKLASRILYVCPESAELHYDIGVALADAGLNAEAMDALNRAVTFDDNARIRASAGAPKPKSGDEKGAQRDSEGAVALRAKDTEAQVRLGVLYLRSGDTQRALPLLQRAADANGTDPLSWLNLGGAFQSAGDLPQAAEAYRRALALKEDLAPARRNLALTLEAMDQLESSKAHFIRALDLLPGDAELLKRYASVLGRLEDTDAQIAALKSGRERFPNDEGVSFDLGMALQRKGAFGESENVLAELVRKNPKHAKALGALGWSKIELKKYREAERSLNASILEDPSDPLAHNNLGVAYLRQNDPEKARTQFQRALELDSGFLPARQNLEALERAAPSAKPDSEPASGKRP